MLPSLLKRNSVPLVDNEKSIIIIIITFLGLVPQKNPHQKLTLRKRVADILGVAENIWDGLVYWKKCNDNTFTPHKRRIESIPTSNTKGEIIDWLIAL